MKGERGITTPDTRAEAIYRLIGFVQDDLRSCQAKLVELRAQLASADITDAPPYLRCPHPSCQASVPSKRKLAEHLYQLHDGPEPEHWIEAEALIPKPAEPIEEGE